MKVIERKIKIDNFENAKNELRDLVKNENFAVLAEHDFGAILKSKGKDITKNAIVFDICNASKARKF